MFIKLGSELTPPRGVSVPINLAAKAKSFKMNRRFLALTNFRLIRSLLFRSHLMTGVRESVGGEPQMW